MIAMDTLEKMGKEAGFTHVGPLDIKTLKLLPEVRQMCESNSCRMYGKNWSCPPGCGSLEACRDRISSYSIGILVQTMGQLEDEMDGEGMMEIEARHKENFLRMYDKLRAGGNDVLAIGAGCCTRCKSCTYPEEPCRFPDKSFASMEAYGMLVTEVCRENGMKYYYGPATIAYTSCFLFR